MEKQTSKVVKLSEVLANRGDGTRLLNLISVDAPLLHASLSHSVARGDISVSEVSKIVDNVEIHSDSIRESQHFLNKYSKEVSEFAKS